MIDIPRSNKQETLPVSNYRNSKDHKRKTHQIIIKNHHFPRFFHFVGDQLAQRRCDNVVTTAWLTLSQRCGTVENERCCNVGLLHCQDVVKTLPQCCYNVATTLSTGFLVHCITDNSDFFPPSKRERVTKVLE